MVTEVANAKNNTSIFLCWESIRSSRDWNHYSWRMLYPTIISHCACMTVVPAGLTMGSGTCFYIHIAVWWPNASPARWAGRQLQKPRVFRIVIFLTKKCSFLLRATDKKIQPFYNLFIGLVYLLSHLSWHHFHYCRYWCLHWGRFSGPRAAVGAAEPVRQRPWQTGTKISWRAYSSSISSLIFPTFSEVASS